MRTRSSSIDDSVRWHPLHEPLTRRAAPVPPSFERNRSSARQQVVGHGRSRRAPGPILLDQLGIDVVLGGGDGRP